jgi:tetratricopeptide (TPR) repeat protein
VVEENRTEVARLLKRGLNHYGLGDLEAAIACWERARALDPSNQAVQDYLETAYEEVDVTSTSARRVPLATLRKASGAPGEEDDTPRSMPHLPPPGERADPESDQQLAAALEDLRAGQLEKAAGQLKALATGRPDRLDVQGYLELVRKQLMQQWGGEIGDKGRVLRRVTSMKDLMSLKLRPEDAFLLSQVDGQVTVDDLISVSSLDRFDTLGALARLLREGVLE